MNNLLAHSRYFAACALFLLVAGISTHAQTVTGGNRNSDGTAIIRNDPRSGERDYSASPNDMRRPGGNTTARLIAYLMDEGKAASTSNPPRYAEAEAAYQRVVKLDRDEVRAYEGLGQIYAALHWYEDSAKAFEQAVKLKPKRAETRYNLGLVYHALGKRDAALEQCTALRALKKKELADNLESVIGS